MDKAVYVSGEDEVTVEVVKRLLAYCSHEYVIKKVIPARGSEVKTKIGVLNKLSEKAPVVLLIDLDANDCAPLLKAKLLANDAKQMNFIFNIAVDEAESWLLADREGIASFLDVELDEIPTSHLTKQSGNRALLEMDVPMKTSLVITHMIAPKSRSQLIRSTIASKDRKCKGNEYNSMIVPFIRNQWNIDAALQHSDSLQRMVSRLKSLYERLD